MAIGFILVKDIPRNCYECDNHNYHFCSWTGDCKKAICPVTWYEKRYVSKMMDTKNQKCP